MSYLFYLLVQKGMLKLRQNGYERIKQLSVALHPLATHNL